MKAHPACHRLLLPAIVVAVVPCAPGRAQETDSVPPVTSLPAQPSPTPSPTRTPTVISPPITFYGVPTPTPTPTPTSAPIQRSLPATAPSSPVVQEPTRKTNDSPEPRPASRATPRPQQQTPITPAPPPSEDPDATVATATPRSLPDMADDAVAPRVPERRQEGASYWVWLLLALGVATAGALFLLWRRIRDRRARTEAVAPDPVLPASPEPDVPRPAMADAVAPVATRDTAPEPLSIAIEPRRIGVAANEAMVEFVLTVTNPGGVAAEDVTVAAWLRSAHADQDREIAALIEAEPAPWLARSTIAAGGARRIESRLTLPRRRINVLTARGRSYFVPVIVVDVRYRMAGPGRVAAAAMAGIRRPDSDKLGPVFLDRVPRSHDDVEARPHAVAAATRS